MILNIFFLHIEFHPAQIDGPLTLLNSRINSFTNQTKASCKTNLPLCKTTMYFEQVFKIEACILLDFHVFFFNE